MFDLVVTEGEFHGHSDREVLLHLLKELKAMAPDLSKLTAATSDNSAALAALAGKVDQLIALHADPAAQSAVDAATSAVVSNTDVLKSVSAKVDSVLVPPGSVS